jgi:DNA helicase II / ATP-dependent DNA helicase PcrA
MWDPDDLEREWPRPDRHRLAGLYREYQARLRRQGGADFDDLLVLAVRLMENDRDLGERYAEKFEHILVDEYQDTNHVQFRLVRRLAQGHGNIMVVGDDDQSIYRWRGADLSNILEFERHFPEARVLRMTQNYRSTGAILELANAVIRHNLGRKEKSLWTENEAGERPTLHVAEDEEAEARWVVGSIRAGARTGSGGYGAAAVLYRVHAQSRALEEACLNLGVPYVLIGGVLFYQRREVKDLLAYLRLAVNPLDEVSFTRAMAAPSRGVGKVGMERILAAAERWAIDPVAACLRLTREDGIKGRALEAVHGFAALIRALQERLPEGPEAVLTLACQETRFLDWLKEAEEGDAEERVANVQELLQGASYFQQRVPGDGVGAYLDQVALYTNLDTRAAEGERVTLMTVHNAKGLEFERVFITGLEEGLFPHASSFDDPEELEEERRLFYVAATRARRELNLSASLDRLRMNRASGLGLSRFLDEIPPAMLRRGGSTVRGRAPAPLRPRREREVTEGDPDPYAGEEAARRDAPDWCGRAVRHAIFGVGRVESQSGQGAEAHLSIIFPQVGRKKILARFVQPVA